MTPQQQGRFCDSCQKCVVDFTGFTDAQLYQFIKEHHGQKVCGRFRSTQLNRQINIPPQPHSQLYKWIIAAGLALVFVAAPEGRAFAQAPKAVEQTPIPQDADKTKADSFSIVGLTLGTQNEVVSGVKIKVYEGGKEVATAYSDDDAQYVIKNLPLGRYDVTAEYDGYRKLIMQGVIVSNKHFTEIKWKMVAATAKDSLPIVTEYRVPLSDKFLGGSTNTMTGEIETTKH